MPAKKQTPETPAASTRQYGLRGRKLPEHVVATMRSLPGNILGPIGRLIADDLLAGVESFESLAEKTGTTGTTLYRMASGMTLPRWDLVEALCDHYGLVLLRPGMKPSATSGSRGKRSAKASGTAPETARIARKSPRR